MFVYDLIQAWVLIIVELGDLYYNVGGCVFSGDNNGRKYWPSKYQRVQIVYTFTYTRLSDAWITCIHLNWNN